MLCNAIKTALKRLEEEKKMRVLITGGGTAGHVNPALAMAGYIREKEPDTEFLYIGAKGAIEEKLVPVAGYDIKTITISGFQRKITPQNIKRNFQTIGRLVSSSIEVKKLIKDFKPDVCLGTGGYVSGPVVREAAKLGIPCVIHESNAYPGVTTKMLSKNVKAVMLAVPEAKKYFDKSVNCVITGNPVRGEVIEADYHASREKLGIDERPLVLSFGGSLGAQAINTAIIDVLKNSAKDKKYQHIHSYGTHDETFIERLETDGFKLEENPQIDVREYINNMSDCLSAADLVIGRAGAVTLSEIEAKAKPSILIPSPNVAENHQFHNAMALVNNEAAEIIEEKNLTGKALWNKIESLINDPDKLKTLGKNAGKFDIPDANSRIYRTLKKAINS